MGLPLPARAPVHDASGSGREPCKLGIGIDAVMRGQGFQNWELESVAPGPALDRAMSGLHCE